MQLKIVLAQVFRGLSIYAAVLAYVSFPLYAQTRFPANETTKDSDNGTCTTALLPDKVAGSFGPQLVFKSSLVSGSQKMEITLALDTPAVSVEIVAANKRTPFKSHEISSTISLLKSTVWSVITASHKAKEPFFITALLPSGEYVSSRYQNLAPEGIIGLLMAQCNYQAAGLFPKSEQILKNEETVLNLSVSQIKHIRWVLARNIRKSTRAPSGNKSFTKADRDAIVLYAKVKRKPASGYLTSQLSRMLLNEAFIPITPNRSANQNYQTSGSWISYTTNNGRCTLAASAQKWTGISLFSRPEMRFIVKKSDTGPKMYFDLLTPNIFASKSPVWATVDGRRYNLQVIKNTVIPGLKGKYLSNELTRAIKRGRSVVISGKTKTEGKIASISFLASGFNSGFQRLASICGRKEILQWVK